ncbi:MAG: hypothetical protein K9J37_15675 [Saprospiraceae bacterium]|nr:hypothetical protein [Saprospiraceae bacterium]MCF8251351.1 hypothetical protein [Saprospiraceae bacterium]MCF8280526.1 hypothetical protein [Bacteroidales bacterium]MCF8313256.1 hypothetical protein [Saprospiraceae bacterium]MCF8441703.1 hypothetical protein [Saprospiraceae bacterium]
MENSKAFTEIVELIASSNPAHIVHYSPGPATLKRVQYLVLRKNEEILTPEEATELQNFLFLENMIGLAKARAYQLLKAA